jgi:hypothetical protein
MICLSLGLLNYALSTWKILQKDWLKLKKLHQIPCSRCDFFTGEYNLKCTVHPHKALKEDAIGCDDYQIAKSSKHSW